MTNEQREFDCYCLDRLRPPEDQLPITYMDHGIIKKILYKIGLRAKIKHEDCFILYTESDRDIDEFAYIKLNTYNEYIARIYSSIISDEERQSIIKIMKTINIYQFVSLLNFIYIYEEFKDLIEKNWAELNMDSLIEI